MIDATFKLTGTKPLLVSNGRMADPHDENALKYSVHMAKRPNVRSKRFKENPEVMVEWLAEERRIQFYGLNYYDPSLGFYLPADNMLYMAREAFFGYGNTSKGGDRLLSILRVDREAFPFEFTGPQTIDERWKAGLYRTGVVKNNALGGAKVRVLQPMFEHWSIQITYSWSNDAEREGMLGRGRTFNAAVLHSQLEQQGRSFGLGAYRKSANYGTFEVERTG